VRVILSVTIAILVSAVLVWILRPLAMRIGLVDSPGERKHHAGHVPLVGGIAMFCGFMFAVLVVELSLDGYRAFFAGTALLVIVGILDDFHDLPPWAHFAAQIVAALIMTLWGGVVVRDLGPLLGSGTVQLGMWAVPFTVFAAVGMINAFNMLDGVDGLAGGVALIAFVLLVVVAFSGNRMVDAQVLLILVCVVSAFLGFNLRIPKHRHARVFMGDAGSMFLGFSLVWFAISLSQGVNRAMTPVTALWVLALPLIDAVSILVRRLSGRRSPFDAARDHLHHILLSLGFSVNDTVATIVGLATTVGVLGLLGLYRGMPEHLLFYGFLSLFVLHLWVTASVAGHGEKDKLTRGSLRRKRSA
jgi:UDP-GlcNAc:undecaprenyl-phosphate GlcNAc-1-phosphate transferase